MRMVSRQLRHIYFRWIKAKGSLCSPCSGRLRRAEYPAAQSRASCAADRTRAHPQALEAAEQQIRAREAEIEGRSARLYLEFELPIEQRCSSRQARRPARESLHIELVSVKAFRGDPEREIAATVFVPEAKKEAYLPESRANTAPKITPTGRPQERAARCVRSIRSGLHECEVLVHRRNRELFPADQQDTWWEVWLRDSGPPPC